MKKKLFCLLLLFILPVCLLFTGCAERVDVEPKETIQQDNGHLFVCIDTFFISKSNYYFVLVHKETKIMYLSKTDGGTTVMVDADGKPLIYEGEL